MPTAYINIGSNLGDRAATISRAVVAIEQELHSHASKSTLYESAPWGYESASPYINVGIAIETRLAPSELLGKLLNIQNSIDPTPHRNDAGIYVDRHIDIDLIAVDDIVIHTEGLTLPHPRMHLREFVLAPMLELAAEWRHPVLNATAGELMARLTNKG